MDRTAAQNILHSIVQEMEQIAQTAVNHQLETLMRNLSATVALPALPY